MNITARSALFFLSLLLLKPLWATNDTDTNNHLNYWQCVAHDREEKRWVAKGSYERVASSKAFESCKKESHEPTSCEASQEFCDYFTKDTLNDDISSINNHVIWRCTALDQMAQSWVGHISANRDDAALDAEAYCQEHSSVPDSCYIDLLTCE